MADVDPGGIEAAFIVSRQVVRRSGGPAPGVESLSAWHFPSDDGSSTWCGQHPLRGSEPRRHAGEAWSDRWCEPCRAEVERRRPPVPVPPDR